MRRKRWLAFAMLAVGTGLLVAAQLAGASGAKYGGIFRYGTTGASVQIDPQIAYITTGWWLEDATAAKLYVSSPQGTLVPQVASGYKVSNGGRTYTFTIRKGFRFSDGTPVTARNFSYAIDRVANKTLASPGAQFITDPNGTEIVGARRVNDGEAHYVRGVVARGRKLVIHLVRPDPSFLLKLTMPFFQATSTKLPLTQEVLGAYPSAGRYSFAHNEVNVLMSIRRNPYWRRGPGRLAPRHLSGLDLHWNQNEQTLLADVQAGRLDEDQTLPPDQRQGLADQYGVNKSRFWVEAQACMSYLAFNNANRLFKGNAPLRRAVNYAVDRTDYLAPAGRFAARPWSRLLPPAAAGSNARQPYPAHADLAKARKLAHGHLRGGKITVYYRSSGTINPAQAQLVRNDLIALGFKPAKITMKGFSGGNIYTAMGVKGNDADIGISLGFCSDWPSGFGSADPGSFLAFWLDPASPWSPVMGLHDPGYLRRFAAANRLHGAARLRALRRLDLDVMRNLAPAVVTMVPEAVSFFSDRVDPASLRYEVAAGNWDIGALALK
jgi:peptide/nickel transport system substrate-binding protein